MPFLNDSSRIAIEMDLIEHAVKFISSLNNTVSVVAVHDKDQTLSVLEVMPPQGTDLKRSQKISLLGYKLQVLQE